MQKENKGCLAMILAFAFYITGLFFMNTSDVEPLKEEGIAQQEEYEYTDSNGNDHEGLSLIRVKGLGRVFVYSDIYFATIGMIFWSMAIGWIVIDEFETKGNKEEFKYALFGNCVLGIMLLALTTGDNYIATILYWLGLVSAFYSVRNMI